MEFMTLGGHHVTQRPEQDEVGSCMRRPGLTLSHAVATRALEQVA